FEKRQVQVRQGRRVGEPDVAAAAGFTGASARDEDRQGRVIVKALVAHTAAIQIKRMVAQSAIYLGHPREALEEIGEERYVKGVDLGDLRELLGVVAVV